MKIITYLVLMVLLSTSQLLSQDKKSAFNNSKDAVVKILASELPEVGFRSNGGSGTGYITSSDGYIITNHHVIDGAVVLNVIVSNKEKTDTVPAYALWSDPDMDMAVLKIDKTNLPYLKFAKKSEIRQGDEVLALGYPGGSKDIKVTWGIISGMPNDSTLNTTAALNSGNSGGPCINLKGEVVGTIYAKKVSVAVEGTGFLRSVDYATKVIEEAKKETKSFKDQTGTESKEAYQELCRAEAAFISINYYEDEEKEDAIKTALQHAIKAINIDSKYILAYFFRASFELYYAFYQCELGEDAISNEYAQKFYKSISTARELDYNDGKYDLYNAVIDNELEDYVEGYEVDCAEWNSMIERARKSYETKDARLQDFDDYIQTGKRPEMLANILGKAAINEIQESKYNYGIRAGILWADNLNYNTRDYGAAVSSKFITLNAYINIHGFGLDIAHWIESSEYNESSYTLIDLRFRSLVLGFSSDTPEFGMRGIIPKLSLKYVSDSFYSASSGYTIGIGYHDIGVEQDDFGLLDKISIMTQYKVLNFSLSKRSRIAIMVNAQMMPGKYLSSGLQLVYHGFSK